MVDTYNMSVHEKLRDQLRSMKLQKTHINMLWKNMLGRSIPAAPEHSRLCKSHGELSDAMLELRSIHSAQNRRDLIILDLDGVLWQRNRKQVVLHPGVRSFLEACYEIADVGYFTSSMLENVESQLHELLTEEQRRDTVFLWDRTYCVPMKLPGRPYGTAKEIQKVLNTFPQYKGGRVLFVDDSPYKMILNPPQNVVIYRLGQSLHSLLDDIKLRFRALAAAGAGKGPSFSPRLPSVRSAPASPLLSRYC